MAQKRESSLLLRLPLTHFLSFIPLSPFALFNKCCSTCLGCQQGQSYLLRIFQPCFGFPCAISYRVIFSKAINSTAQLTHGSDNCQIICSAAFNEVGSALTADRRMPALSAMRSKLYPHSLANNIHVLQIMSHGFSIPPFHDFQSCCWPFCVNKQKTPICYHFDRHARKLKRRDTILLRVSWCALTPKPEPLLIQSDIPCDIWDRRGRKSRDFPPGHAQPPARIIFAFIHSRGLSFKLSTFISSLKFF